MKKVLFFLLLLCFFNSAIAEAPRLISYQGRLTDASGSPINGTRNITFKLYTTQTGGSPIWTETQNNVPISNGLYSVMLGSVSAFPPSVDFSQQYWLGVTVEGTPEMTPRYQLGSSPYALNLASLGATNGQVLKWNATNSKWVPSNDVVGVIGAGTPNTIPIWVNESALGSSIIYQSSDEKIGIGTTSPQSKFEVQADIPGGQAVGAFFNTRIGDRDATGVAGVSADSDGFGIGGVFRGGRKGVFASVSPTGSATYWGVSGYVNGGSGTNIGVEGEVASGSGTNYGVRGKAFGTGTNYGLFGNAAGAATNYGVYGTAEDLVSFRSGGRTLPSTKYGVYGSATGTGIDYGIYGTAIGGSQNYAGYFDQGSVRIVNNLFVGGPSLTSGYALLVESSGTGTANATAYIVNRASSGIAFMSQDSSSDGCAIFSQKGTGYILRADGWTGGWHSVFTVNDTNKTRIAEVIGGADTVIYARSKGLITGYFENTGSSSSDYAGYFKGNVHITGKLTTNDTLTYVISFADFTVLNPSVGTLQLLGGRVSLQSSPSSTVWALANLPLPQGAKVTKVTSYWYDDDPSHDITITMQKNYYSGNVSYLTEISTMNTTGSAGAGSTTAFPASTISYIDPTQTGISYSVKLTFPSGINTNSGVRAVHLNYVMQ